MDKREFIKQVPPYKLIESLVEKNQLNELNVVMPVGDAGTFIHGRVEHYRIDDDSLVVKFDTFETPGHTIGNCNGIITAKRDYFRVAYWIKDYRIIPGLE
jgi:hypothetical protein